MNEKRKLIPLIVSVSLAGMVTGLFLGHDLRLPAFMLSIVATWVMFVVGLKDYIEVTKNWKPWIVRTIAVGLIGIPTGLFLGGDLLPSATPAEMTVKPPENEVWMINHDFNPKVLTVPAGTTITWYNKDMEYHTVTSYDGLFNSPITEFPMTYTFTKPGTYSYYCTPHPDYEPHSEAVGVVIVVD